MYKELDYMITLSGSAETKEGAFNKVFSQIKPQVSKEFKELILRIEPKDIAVISAKETTHTERFLGFFFPRTKTRYEIRANVTVKLGLIEYSQVHFEQEIETPSLLQKVLRLGD